MGELFASVTYPASKASFCLLGGGGEKVSLPESRQAFEVATAQMSGLVNLVFPCHKHPFIDKPLVITMPAEASAQLLGLGSKLYPSNIPSTLNKDLT